MLHLDMNLEADLGIDSIKRVEILSAVREKAPSLPELPAETLGTLQTLRQIVDVYTAQGAPAPQAAPEAPVAHAPAVAAPAPSAIHRWELARVPAPLGGPVALPPLHATGDAAAVAPLAAALRARGVDVVVGDPDGTRGVLFVAGDGAETVKAGFLAAKRANLGRGGAFLVVTRLGGDAGLAGADNALTGGLAGLTKTVALEHPEARVQVVDISAGIAPERVAEVLLHAGPVERMVDAEGVHSFESILGPEHGVAETGLGPADVVVISGGARGVTAACAVELARSTRCRLVLLGRSAIDAPESAALAAARDEAAVKKVLFSEQAGLKPAELGRRAAAVLASREARATLADIRAAGSEVRYLAVDVTDPAAVATALDAVRAEWGAITGVVHGAGVIHDKRLVEKTEAQWDAVWSTKVAGAHALLEATRADPLKVLVFFSSVAGRAGNPGQSDYAAANEALNKLAALERRRRPATVVKSIGWGPWEGGMVTPALKAAFTARGVDLIPLDRGARLFVEELAWRPEVVELVVGGAAERIDGGAKALTRTYDARHYPFLRDHAIADAPVLPVAMALEWLLRAAKELHPDRVVSACRNVQVLKGIVLDAFDRDGSTLEIGVLDDSADKVRLEIRTPGGPVHYRADVEYGGPRPEAPATPSTGPLPRYPLPLREIYGRHLFHGPAFHAIRGLDGMSDMAAAAEVAGANALGWPSTRWAIDPAAFDGGLQLAVLWTRHHTQAAALPTRIDAYVPYAQPADGPIRVVLKGRKAGTRNSVSDLAFIDHQGTLYAELKGVELHTLPGGNFPSRVAIAK